MVCSRGPVLAVSFSVPRAASVKGYCCLAWTFYHVCIRTFFFIVWLIYTYGMLLCDTIILYMAGSCSLSFGILFLIWNIIWRLAAVLDIWPCTTSFFVLLRTRAWQHRISAVPNEFLLITCMVGNSFFFFFTVCVSYCVGRCFLATSIRSRTDICCFLATNICDSIDISRHFLFYVAGTVCWLPFHGRLLTSCRCK